MKRYIRAAVKDVMDENPDVWVQVINDPRTSRETLVQLSKNDMAVSHLVYYRDIPSEFLDMVAEDTTDSIVLDRLVEHPNISTYALSCILEKDIEQLKLHPNDFYGYCRLRDTLQHPKTDPAMLDKVARDPQIRDYIKQHILANPNISDDTYQYLHDQDIWDDRWKKEEDIIRIHDYLAEAWWRDSDGRTIAQAMQKYNPNSTPKEIADRTVSKYSEFKDDYDGILHAVGG